MTLSDYAPSKTTVPSTSWTDRMANRLKLPKNPKLRSQYFLGSLVLLLVLVGSAAAFFLAQSNADLRNQASGGNPYDGRCTTDAQCPANQQCVTIGGASFKVCQNRPTTAPQPSSLPVNENCTQSSQCQSGLCQNNKCTAVVNNRICTVNHPTYQAARGGCVVRSE